MISYFDTSALLKKYVEEEGADFIRSLFRGRHLIAVTSAITAVEGCHVICRQCREEKISPKTQATFLRRFYRDLGQFRVVGYGTPVARGAQKIIRAHVLKTLDAIHLASALTIKHNSKIKIHFVSSDEKQGEVAQKYGLTLLNPTD